MMMIHSLKVQCHQTLHNIYFLTVLFNSNPYTLIKPQTLLLLIDSQEQFSKVVTTLNLERTTEKVRRILCIRKKSLSKIK